MKSVLQMAAAALMVSSLSGCAMMSGGSTLGMGSLYASYKGPGSVGTGTASKTGESCASSILGIIATGDASIAAAKSAGGISEVAHVDHDNFSVLGLYAKSCTIVSGR